MAEKSALMRALLDGVLYDLMVRSDVYNIAVSDGVTLAEKLAEIINAINSRMKVSDIVNDLTTGGNQAPLSAEQGKVLKALIDGMGAAEFSETDPTVPDWAKADSKPAYTAEEIHMQGMDGSPLLIDMIQSIVNALNAKYSAGNPPPYPVASVNGKTGTVQLAAGDVGAEPAGTSEGRVSDHNTDTNAHKDIRLQLQNISTGKLDADKLPEAIGTALAQAKESGAFDGAKGEPGEPGTGIVAINIEEV